MAVPASGHISGERKSVSAAVPTYGQMMVQSAKEPSAQAPVEDGHPGTLSSPCPFLPHAALHPSKYSV